MARHDRQPDERGGGGVGVKVAWFSTGVSSLCSILLAKDVDKIIYTHVGDQHEDSLRYLYDCERYLGQKIEILQSPYKTVDSVVRACGFCPSAAGMKCTEVLKRRVRKKWEREQKKAGITDLTYVWGYDAGEPGRVERLTEAMPTQEHEFPLLDAQMSKQSCHGMLAKTKIKRPLMYDLGYNNNNCIACLKGGMGYWNKIRRDFPDYFKSRAILERDTNHSFINGVFLDELDPERGRMTKEIMPACDIACEIMSYTMQQEANHDE